MQGSGRSKLLEAGSALRSVDWSVWLAVWISCLVSSFLGAPVPGVNEPHYLALARSFVEPGWCARDPFLQSTPVHWAFLALVGWPVRWWGFETAAIVGRVLGCGAISVGWAVLMGRLAPIRWFPLWTLWGTLAAAAVGNFSGEWMIGGIEGKVFAYGAVFGSLACLSRGKIHQGVFWTGVVLAFHPVVGMWHLLAVVGSFVVLRLFPRVVSGSELKCEDVALPERFKGGLWCGGILCGFIGMIPAVMLLVNVDPELARRGTEIQVYDRLAHHLNPVVFPAKAYLSYGVLLLAGLMLVPCTPRNRCWQFCQWYVGWCVLFALAGVCVGFIPVWFPGSSWNNSVPRLLKFYPFRLADVLLPWFVIANFFAMFWRSNWPRALAGGGLRSRLMTAVTGVAWLGILLLVSRSEQSPALTRREVSDWRETCDWIRTNTPSDALCTTTRRGWAFKWYAQRAEFFSYKDAPQDAAGLVAWEERQKLLWELFAERFSRSGLVTLREKTGCDYAVLGRATPCDLPPTFENRSFAVYDLRGLENGGGICSR